MAKPKRSKATVNPQVVKRGLETAAAAIGKRVKPMRAGELFEIMLAACAN